MSRVRFDPLSTRTVGSAPVSCPGENTLAARAEGRLQGVALSESDAHLDVCADCRRLLAALMREGSSLPSSPAPQEPGFQGSIGRYLVLHRLGEGGMGAVFAAYDPQLDRKVAVKLLRRSFDASSEI
jgi:hypothetical protein